MNKHHLNAHFLKCIFVSFILAGTACLSASTTSDLLPTNSDPHESSVTTGQSISTSQYQRIPLYRFSRNDNPSHFFTALESEKEAVLREMSEYLTLEGVSHYVVANHTLNSQPVYRMYNSLSGAHFYTASAAERDNVLATMSWFSLEGVAFYVFHSPEPRTLPVYRFYVPSTGSHFFTIDEGEKNRLLSTAQSTMQYDGVAWYAYYQSAFQESFFSIDGADFQPADFPISNTPNLDISSMNGNPYVLAGGGNLIDITTTARNLARLIVGIQGESGYYSIPVSTSTSGETTVSISMQMSQQFDRVIAMKVAFQDISGNTGNSRTFTIEHIEAGTGLLQVSVVWDKQTDVDLHLIEPDGERIYYANERSRNGGVLDVDSNPACRTDGINNENIYYPEGSILEAGEYSVVVDLYADCVGQTTSYVAYVVYNGVAITPTYGQNPLTGTLETNAVGLREEVMKFSIHNVAAARVLKYTFPVQETPGNGALQTHSNKVEKLILDH